MDAFRLVLTAVVAVGVVVAILLFEKRRSDQITRDTRRMARGGRDSPPGDPGDDEGRAQ